jgi:hypothetical protein
MADSRIAVDGAVITCGVESGKLKEFKHFKSRAIDPAVLEVNGLGEFGCKVEPIYSGRKVTSVRLSWWAKNLDERISTLNELRFSRVGRRARLQGKVETLAGPLASLPAPSSQDVTVQPDRRNRDGALGVPPIPRRDRSVEPRRQGRRSSDAPQRTAMPLGESGLTEGQLRRLRRDFPGLDIPWLEREFRAWVAERDEPEDYAAAFYGFLKQKRRQVES